MSRSLRVLSLVCILVVLPIQPAHACSCDYGDPRDRFADADGAFVGTFVESHPVEPNPTSSAADTIYTFLLDEEHKGELGDEGDTIEVHAPLSGASCGLETQTGEQYGIYLYLRDDGAWASNLCSQVSPQTLREGASPLPAPTSDGPPRLIAGGSFGDTQTMVLDRNGDTVGYGAGDRDVTFLASCPAAARIMEVATAYPDPPQLVVRDLGSLDAVRTVELPFGPRQTYRNMSVAGVHCLDETGRTAVVFATNYREPEATSVLVRVGGNDLEVVHEGTGLAATFGDRVAYLRQGKWGRRLTKVSLRDGAERFVTRLPARFSTRLALSPDGSKLASVALPPYERMDNRPARIYTVDLPGGRVRTRSLGTGERYAEVLWLSDSRLVMFVEYPDDSRVFDLRLRTRERFGRWDARATTIVGRTAYGVDYEGRLIGLELPGGQPRVVRRLPSPVVYDLVTINS